MEAYQERVVSERDQLSERLSNLTHFMNDAVFKALPGEEQHRMQRQSYYMSQYLNVLNARITVWENE